jgi:3-deoxy-D-manno-oct-2-ulosonic acid (Kdo) hydroxylase
MTKKITVNNIKFANCPSSASGCIERAKSFCKELENGNILYFPKCPFDFPKEEIQFLINQKQKKTKKRKNISYKPRFDKLSNADVDSEQDFQKLHEIMKSFSYKCNDFLSKLLTPYASKWKIDYASFRPFQEKERKLRLRARNDLLHVDAFPSRPMFGNRILRFFININPEQSRHWITSESFESLVEKYAGSKELPFAIKDKKSLKDSVKLAFKKSAKTLGIPVTMRSSYDHFMLKMHNFLKENQTFQEGCNKDHWDFSPGSCWAVFTDIVTHAALEGQYALEQTFLLPADAQINPEKAPINILERICGWEMSKIY